MRLRQDKSEKGLLKFRYASGKFYHVQDVDGAMNSFDKIMEGFKGESDEEKCQA